MGYTKVSLKNGSEEPKFYAEITMDFLKMLLEDDQSAFRDLVAVCKGADKMLISGSKIIKQYGFLNTSDGSPDPHTQNVVLSAVVIEPNGSMTIHSPFAS